MHLPAHLTNPYADVNGAATLSQESLLNPAFLRGGRIMEVQTLNRCCTVIYQPATTRRKVRP